MSMVDVNKNKKLREPKNTVTACIVTESGDGVEGIDGALDPDGLL